MKQSYFILTASIAAALAGAPAALLAQPVASSGTAEAPRVTQAVSNSSLFTIPKTHLGFLGTAKGSTNAPLAGTFAMNHMQLVLKPSVERQAAMEQLIANQHNPKSPQFQKWLTPEQFGEQFGVLDSDIAAVTSWLTAQGFTVNNVYPNKTQIDFSGTAAQVSQAFHTQENLFTNKQGTHLSNTSDISIPAALKSVVAGVMGLNDFRASALLKETKIAQWDASKKGFVAKDAAPTTSKKIGLAVNYGAPGTIMRGLAPNDMATMYGIKTIRANGVTGKGITIAVVEDNDMVASDWTNFVSTFNLGQYGGTFSEVRPAPPSGATNCYAPFQHDNGETILDAEWATAIAPGANIEVASCGDYDPDFNPATSNSFGGVFIASTNVINAATRPDVISASYGYGEFHTDSASKTAIDLMWAQADAEGISVFVAAGDSGTSADFNGNIINGYYGNTTIDANALATSPHVTSVGGTDLADILDGTTSQYFAAAPSVVGGSALSYVPEIPWNQSCGNGVAATSWGFSSALALCQEFVVKDPTLYSISSEAGGGGPSTVDAKPTWQRQVFNAAKDTSRDIPDVAMFAGSFGQYTWVITCTNFDPCAPGFTGQVALSAGTSLASPMFAGIQALMDQGLAARGLPADQGNAAPTLYALAAQEYGGPTGPAPASLAACNANNGINGTSSCVFHNITRGSNSTNCRQQGAYPEGFGGYVTPNCYFYASGESQYGFEFQVGLTTTDAAPTSYGVSNKAFGAQPGWSFTSGLGSVNATNLLMAWRAFVNAPPAAP